MSRKCFTAEHQIQCVAHQIGWSASGLVRPYFQHALELLGDGRLALFRQLADVQAGFQNFVVVKASHFAIGGVGKTPDLVGFFTHRVVSVCGLEGFALFFGWLGNVRIETAHRFNAGVCCFPASDLPERRKWDLGNA